MRRALEPLAALLLAAIAMALVFESGSRGFFPLDQSNVFEGGYRLLRGQVPYRDFLMPVGPLAFVIQVPFFLLFGVNNRAQLLHAGVVNAAAALFAVGCVKRLFPSALLPAYLAGLSTAAWFYPVFGTPAFDQTALFFHLAALLVLLPALADGGDASRRESPTALASGFLSGLAFFSKQNAGALSAACLLLVILVTAGGRRRPLVLRFLAGLGGCAALFLIWLAAFSDPAAFLRHFLAIPIAEGLRRATSADFQAGVLADMRSSGLTLALVLLGPLLSLTGLALDGLSLLARRRALLPRGVALTFAVSLSLGLLQWSFIRVTSNLADNAFGLAGLADALALLAAPRGLGARIAGRAGLAAPRDRGGPRRVGRVPVGARRARPRALAPGPRVLVRDPLPRRPRLARPPAGPLERAAGRPARAPRRGRGRAGRLPARAPRAVLRVPRPRRPVRPRRRGAAAAARLVPSRADLSDGIRRGAGPAHRQRAGATRRALCRDRDGLLSRDREAPLALSAAQPVPGALPQVLRLGIFEVREKAG